MLSTSKFVRLSIFARVDRCSRLNDTRLLYILYGTDGIGLLLQLLRLLIKSDATKHSSTPVLFKRPLPKNIIFKLEAHKRVGHASTGVDIVSHSQTAIFSFTLGWENIRPNIKEKIAVWLCETRVEMV